MSRNSSDLTKYYEEGKAQLKGNSYSKAIRAFNKAISAFDPLRDVEDDIGTIICARSAANFYNGKLEDSLSDAEETIKRRPMWSKGYFRKAEVLIEFKRFSEAIQTLAHAKTLENDARSIDILDLRIIRAQQEIDAEEEGLYFRQLKPGKEICLGSYNPIKKLIHEFARGMQNIVYAVGDKRGRECILVDVCWDAEGVMGMVEGEGEGMTIVGCIVTHNHFDHVGGKPPPPFKSYGIRVQGVATVLKKYPLIPVYIHCDDADAFQVETGIDPSRIIAVTDNYKMKIGGIDIEFIHTPGHTPGSQCILVNQRRLLTGDTLFGGSCGRVDLPGGCAIAMYDSLQNRIGSMEGDIVLYPGHSYGGMVLTSIKRERNLGVLKPTILDEWLSSLGSSASTLGRSGSTSCSHHQQL